LRALSMIGEAHAIGSVAKHAVSEAARLGAFDTLRERGDRVEIVSVAMHSDHRDTALAAVEWITEPADLEQVATRGRNKSAAKRARTRTHEAAAQADAAARAEADAARQQAAAKLAEATPVETIVTQQDAPVADAPVTDGPIEMEARVDDQPADSSPAESPSTSEPAAASTEVSDEISSSEPQELVAADVPASESQGAPAEAADLKARERREAIGRLRHLAGRIEPLLTRDDVSLKAADRALRDLRTAMTELPAPGPDLDEVLPRLKEAQAALTPRVQELREATEWRQWANVGIQEQLCVQMEALATAEDPEGIARKVRELQQQWRTAADVPRAQADVLWRRFKAAHDIVWPRCEAHFAAEAEARSGNLARKIELCEKVEALSDSTNWIATADAIKALQAEWKTIGPVSRGREKAIWDRFRSACDKFFTRRHSDLADRKKAWAENLARKEALCVRAEALAESTDWEAAAAEVRRLQTDWKSIGPVKKSRSDAIWQRFRSACDRFFTRYASRHDTARAERIAAREAICADVEALLPADEVTEPPADLVTSLRAVRQRYSQEISSRGVDPDRARQLDERFDRATAALVSRWPGAFAGTEFDPETNRKRMEALVVKIEDLLRSLTGPPSSGADPGMSPTVRLAAMLKEALAANTIGGKADDESRWRSAAEEVRQARASWSRLGHVPDEQRRELTNRFNEACSKILAGAPSEPAQGRRDHRDSRDSRARRDTRDRRDRPSTARE
ncbi:MAG: DUF349 domain-containing protein, partial [Vicinamibacterales bacterium]